MEIGAAERAEMWDQMGHDPVGYNREIRPIDSPPSHRAKGFDWWDAIVCRLMVGGVDFPESPKTRRWRMNMPDLHDIERLVCHICLAARRTLRKRE